MITYHTDSYIASETRTYEFSVEELQGEIFFIS